MSLQSSSAELCGSFATRPRSSVDLLESLSQWRASAGGPARWQLQDGVLEVVPGTGDLISVAQADEYQLHVEFWLPEVRALELQNRANSGVYLHGRFELQLLDSSDRPPSFDTCGAIYKMFPPLRSAELGTEEWQCLEIAFRSSGGAALVTAFLNGMLIHNQVLLTQSTAGALEQPPYPAVMLQDHGAPVRFRNLWLL